MTFSNLLENSGKYSSVLSIERFFPHPVRRWVGLLAVTVFTGVAIYILGFDSSNLPVAGTFFIAFAIWLLLAGLQAYFFSFYFLSDSDEQALSYELADILYRTHIEDITLSFLATQFGRKTMKRVGVVEEGVQLFQEKRAKPLTGFVSDFDKETRTIYSYVSQIVNQDTELQTFLFQNGVQTQDFLSAVQWMERNIQYKKRRERWWSKENLSQFQGLGVEWSYGKAYHLATFSRALTASHPTLTSIDYFGTYTASVESILTRNRNANVLVVGEAGVGKEDIVLGLQKHINAGKVDSSLRNLRVVKIDMHALGAQVGTKQDLEQLLIDVFTEAEETGNTLLVIPLTDLMRLGDEYNTDAPALLDPFLMSNDLHIIAIANTDSYHQHIERNSKIMQRFERVMIKEGDEDVRIRILEDIALDVERAQHVFFTWPAIESIARSANRYFTDASHIEKATDMLHEVATNVRHANRKMVTVKDVDAIVERLTGVAIGAARGAERDKLINLEDALHERIIGQNEAITAISSALRRSRSGLSSPNRPVGSFLFLGPTGVGKTETTKALADVFFEDANKVVRLDMSEYTGANALERLIGTSDGTTIGTLASALRDTPYGVLHLDEFEKTNREVINLFLQVLDEGMFTDARGEQINARNVIIVATSNAGSDLIYEYLKDGGSTNDYKDAVVSTIIKRGIFSPELINRFDGAILFHPLADEHLAQIAELMLAKLNNRLSEKGIKLNVTPELVTFLVEKGRNPQFGARPLRRAVQDHIENIIADRMVRGDIKTGDIITFTEDDLRKDEEVGVAEGVQTDSSGETFTFADEE